MDCAVIYSEAALADLVTAFIAADNALSQSRIKSRLSGTWPRCEPLLKRFPALMRSPSGKNPLNTDVFIQLRPMNSEALPNKLMIVSLRSRAMQQSRIPCQRR